jgi:molybdate transport system ATP-binding protein
MSEPRLHVDASRRLPALDLRVRLDLDTETLVLFGPSGAGKTTTLDMVAGLADPDAGEISLDGRTFFRRGAPGEAPPVRVPARDRHIGYVFQQYALFPHMTALQNVMYPLGHTPAGGRGGRAGRAAQQGRAHALLERVRLDGVASHFPRELSGGQQQRVALARALAAQPRLLLLDEPFSAVDAAVREHLQRDVAELQSELGLIVIYVTHRLEDAFAVGHRIAVLREGRIEQVGPIAEVFRRPATAGVAEVMGIRNLLSVRVVQADAGELRLDWDGLELSAPPQSARVGDRVLAYIRPEEVKLLYSDRPVSRSVAHNRFEGRVQRVLSGAGFREITVRLPNGREVDVRFPLLSYGALDLTPGGTVQLALRREALVLLGPG